MPTWGGIFDGSGGGGDGGGGAGDVAGPASATDDNLATFDGATGKLIQDSGQSVASVLASAGDVDGPASATDKALPSFNGTGGKTLQATSVTLSDTTGVFTNTTANTGFTWTPSGAGNHLFSTGLIQLGGATSSFPALKRNGVGVEVRLADDSTYGTFTVRTGPPGLFFGGTGATNAAMRTTAGAVPLVEVVTATESAYADFYAATLKATARLLAAKGADVASANNITLGNGNYFDITGTTQINTIAGTGWTAGSVVVLQFDASVTVKHNTAGTGVILLLAGAADFAATAGDTLTLVYETTAWREVARTAI